MLNDAPIVKRITSAPLHRLCLPVILCSLVLGLGYVLAYRAPFRYALPLEGPTGFVVNGLSPTEYNNLTPLCWTSPRTEFRLPALGQTLFSLQLSFHTPLTTVPRTLDITWSGQWVERVQLVPGWQVVTLILPSTTATPVLRLNVDPPLRAQGRVLGVALDQLSIEQLAPTVVPFIVLYRLVAIILVVIAIVFVAGARPLTMTTGAFALLAGMLLTLTWQRFNTLLLLAPLTKALLIALPFACGIRWLARYPTLPKNTRWLVGLRLIVVGLFVVRVVGMWYPTFREIDHMQRIHQIQTIARGGQHTVEASLNNQFEWGSAVQVPYSLWAYYPFVPLVYLVRTQSLKLIVEGVTAMLEASIPLLLFAIVTGAGEDARTGWWAAATYAGLPIGFLYYHDGSFPTIIGLWMTVVALFCLQRLAVAPGWRWGLFTMAAVAISMLLYVTHLAFVPLLVGTYAAALWTFGRTWQRTVARWSAAALIGAIILSVALYYGPLLPHMLLTTIPLVWTTIRTHGSVGGAGSSLPGALVGSFPQQAWGHFRVLGLFVGAAGVVLALRRRHWLGYLGLAYAGCIVLTVLIDTRFGLWNKHLYFALPGVALLGGYAFAKLEHGSKAGQWLARACLTLLLVASLHAWIARVLFYQWSLRTL